jgi:predicted AlkP superfamily phosphohydrolase/phosphomutase
MKFDKSASKAFLSDISGVKSYSFGGVWVQDPRSFEYEKIREQLIGSLSSIRDIETGGLIVRWVKRRESVFSESISKDIPDILFELNRGYGAGTEVMGDLLSSNRTSNLVPGTHKGSSAVLLSSNRILRGVPKQPENIADYYSLVIHLLGLKEGE